MFLEKSLLSKYQEEISELYKNELSESTLGLIFFGIFAGKTLQAVASVKNYMGSWYLRGCVVKPEFRGKGLQRQLIQERLEYLTQRTRLARVSVSPNNEYSLQNIIAMGFQFERKKKLENGEVVFVYKKEL